MGRRGANLERRLHRVWVLSVVSRRFGEHRRPSVLWRPHCVRRRWRRARKLVFVVIGVPLRQIVSRKWKWEDTLARAERNLLEAVVARGILMAAVVDEEDEALYGGGAGGGEAPGGDVGLGGGAAVAEEAALEDEAAAGGKEGEEGEGAASDDEDDGVDVIIDQDDLQTPGRPGAAMAWGGAALVRLSAPLPLLCARSACAALLCAPPTEGVATGSPTASTCAKAWRSNWANRRRQRRATRARRRAQRRRALSIPLSTTLPRWRTSPGANRAQISRTGSTTASTKRHGRRTARNRWS